MTSKHLQQAVQVDVYTSIQCICVLFDVRTFVLILTLNEFAQLRAMFGFDFLLLPQDHLNALLDSFLVLDCTNVCKHADDYILKCVLSLVGPLDAILNLLVGDDTLADLLLLPLIHQHTLLVQFQLTLLDQFIDLMLLDHLQLLACIDDQATSHSLGQHHHVVKRN